MKEQKTRNFIKNIRICKLNAACFKKEVPARIRKEEKRANVRSEVTEKGVEWRETNLNSNEERRTNTREPISVDVIAFLTALRFSQISSGGAQLLLSP